MLLVGELDKQKLYSGIRYYNHQPLTADDFHEYEDTQAVKNSYVLNQILGHGTLSEPSVSISANGISTSEPIPVLVDGDIVLVGADTGPLVPMSEITSAGFNKGKVLLLGWYQHLTYSSVLKAYGGVRNSSFTENDIIDETLGIQNTTRYQFRWDIVLVSDTDSLNSISWKIRNESGELTGATSILNTTALTDTAKIISKSQLQTYQLSDMFVIPLMTYELSNSVITNAKVVKPLSTGGALKDIIKSQTTPTGDIEEGSIWYNPETMKFSIFMENGGFIPTSKDIALVQYRNTVTIDTENPEGSNLRLNIGITEYAENDILQVVYNGVTLTQTIHYTLHATDKAISLLSFKTEIGDQVTFIVTKLLDETQRSSIASTFSNHVSSTGSDVVKGHVNLSDTASTTLDKSKGVAATPKAVYEATIIKDKITNKRYKLTISSGVLGVEEVS